MALRVDVVLRAITALASAYPLFPCLSSGEAKRRMDESWLIDFHALISPSTINNFNFSSSLASFFILSRAPLLSKQEGERHEEILPRFPHLSLAYTSPFPPPKLFFLDHFSLNGTAEQKKNEKRVSNNIKTAVKVIFFTIGRVPARSAHAIEARRGKENALGSNSRWVLWLYIDKHGRAIAHI
jgi:hypothetical protein